MALSCRIPPGHPDGGGGGAGSCWAFCTTPARLAASVACETIRTLAGRGLCKTGGAARLHCTLDNSLGRLARPAPDTLRSAVVRHWAVPVTRDALLLPTVRSGSASGAKRSNAAPRTVGSSKAVWKQVFSSGRPSWPRRVSTPCSCGPVGSTPSPPPAAPSVSLPCCA